MNTKKAFPFICLAALSMSCEHFPVDFPTPVPVVFTGEPVALGNGKAWSIVITSPAGEPRAIGVQLEADALEGLPTGHPHGVEHVLRLPDEIAVPPYDHITLDWNEHGHEPPGVYDLPHFDMHFYFMSEAERDAITPFNEAEFNKPLPPHYLAPDYLETPGGVPRMGAHIIDLLSPEIAGTGIFTHTFIYGKYDGKLNFLEPMVTRDFLLSKETVHKPIRQPEAWQQAGYYPSGYRISYDKASNTYLILLYDLNKF